MQRDLGNNAAVSRGSDLVAKDRVEFSVVIPSYNRRELLGRALDSILGQSYAPREIIVVDDGSSDGTGRILRERYPDVRYYYQCHSGVSAARNRGIRAASSQWIALLDSDDAWTTDKLDAQAAAIRANREARLVHTNEIWIRNGRPLAQKRRHRKYGGSIFEHCLPRCIISPSSAVIRRDLFDDFGLFDESLRACEDYDLWLRVCARETVSFVDKPLVVKYGGHADQLSRKTAALDRYRIEALHNLLESGILTDEQRAMTNATLHEKIRIYVAGAKKRGRRIDFAKYETMAIGIDKCRP